MAVLGGQLDGIGAGEDSEQRMREVGVDSGRTIGAEPANAPCDGVTDGVREAVGLPEVEGEEGALDLFGVSDAELDALVAGMNHEPDVLPEPQAMELLEALRSANDSDAGQAAA